MEEQIHDNDKMVAMGVIENEMEVMKEFIKHSKGAEKDFYEDKLSSLEFSKSVRIYKIIFVDNRVQYLNWNNDTR